MESNGNLVLSRKVGESICIGDNVTVTIVEFRGDKIRVAVQAPKSMPIRRAELQPIELGATRGVNEHAYGCHLCRGMNCVDKQCRDSKPASASVRAGDVPNDKE